EFDGTSVIGHVAETRVVPATSGAPPRSEVVVTTSDPLEPRWAGANVRATIVAARTDTAGLVVPVAAGFAVADLRPIVEVAEPDGTFRRVVVETAVSADGFVQVTPVDGVLEVGDRVVVGAEWRS